VRAPRDFFDLFDVAGYMGPLTRCCEGMEEVLHSRDEEEEEGEGQGETWSESGVQEVFSGPNDQICCFHGVYHSGNPFLRKKSYLSRR